MPKINEFTRKNLRELLDAMETALQEVSKEYNVNIKLGRAKFSSETFDVKFSGSLASIDGKSKTREEIDFERYAFRYGLTPEDLGKEFDFVGEKYKIIGARPRATKYPICATKGDGKTYRFRARDVKRGLID